MNTECRFELCLSEEGGFYENHFTVAGEAPIVVPFDFDYFTVGDPGSIIGKLEAGSCTNQELAYVGTYLWNALCADTISDRVHQIEGPYGIELVIPDDANLSRLPWEALFDEERQAYLGTLKDRTLFRLLPSLRQADMQPEREGALSMLVVVPEGSGLDAASELSKLRALALQLGPQRLRVAPLNGLVTSDRIRNELAKGYDILHFIGHSRFTGATGSVEIRINSDETADGERWMDANQFASLLTGTTLRLVVFNSCESATTTSAILGSAARQVTRRAAIPAVVAMRYKIDDVSAGRFSDAFYRELLSAESMGRVDRAIQKARDSLYGSADAETFRSFITPVLYLADGHQQLFAAERVPPLGTATPPKRAAAITIDKELIEALREGNCLPVIGHGSHPAATRDALPSESPTLLRLVSDLAKEVEYPDADDLQVLTTMSDLADLLSPRVFQHVESLRARYKLVSWLEARCQTATTPRPLTLIASWQKLPGVIYTHFDGLMERALKHVRGEDPRTMNSPNQALVSSDQVSAQASERILLFNLRGTLTDPASLILTDADHERLLDALATAKADVTSLFRKNGRAVLFIGVTPRDPVVRRLARLYLDPTSRTLQGPRFFVTPHLSAADQAYWREFNITWIEKEPAEVIDAIDAQLREGTP